MSVLSSKLELDQDFSVDETHQGRLVLSWLVTVDSKFDGWKTVISGAQITGPHKVPKQFEPYQYGSESDENLLAKRIRAKRKAGTTDQWIVSVEYDNKLDPGQSAENPLDRDPIDDWDFEQFQRAIEKDIDGEPVVNPVGQPFDPPITFDDSRPILVYTRNEAAYPSQILTYQDAVNSDPFLVFPAKTAKVNIRAGKRFENGFKFYETRYSFHFRYDGWEREGLNRGTRFKLEAADSESEAVDLPPGAKPVLLAEDGTITTAAAPSYTKVKGYREVPFGPLNIVIF